MTEEITRKHFNEEGKEVRSEVASPPPSAVRSEIRVEVNDEGTLFIMIS